MFLVHPYLDLPDMGSGALVVTDADPARAAQLATAAATYVLDTPGPTPATVCNVPLRNLQRPWFPADPDIPNLHPTLLT